MTGKFEPSRSVSRNTALKALQQREAELYWAVHEARYPSQPGDNVAEGKAHDSMDALLADLDFKDAEWPPAGPLALSSLSDSLVSNPHGKKTRAARHFFC